MTVKNILLDLDGTLTDPKIGIHTCIRYAMEKMGQPLADDTDLDWTIGPPLKASFIQLLNSAEDALAEQALAFYRERFSTIGLYENELYPHVIETLKALVERGYNLYLATAKPQVFAIRILEHFKLLDYFTKPYGSELTGERTNKGDLIHYILQQEQLVPEYCMMVGDREYDILGARRNGIETIAVTYGYGTDAEIAQAAPKLQIRQFAELLNYFN
ncbi:HAD-IA family hydrolase [Acinetobacter sp. ME22]|uniref:HAD-IA family hydrolase n=1 Tax=Acinetobacter sp. ME22 TaxID=2904802 RepID=UPI001EDA52E5|nr:HAD-IA family hydrolase [Acinetobacter sp. ME22]